MDPVKGSNGNILPIIMILIGLVSLLIGCTIAINRSGENESRDQLESDIHLLAHHLGDSSPLSMISLDTGITDLDLLEGRSFRLEMVTVTGEIAVFHHPDISIFQDMEGGSEESLKKQINAETGDGRVIPAVMEVVLRE